MSTFYAALPDPIKAQLLVGHLLNDGIQLDDISLVAPTTVSIDGSAPVSTGDASFFVGGKDDPAHDLVDESSRGADYEAASESPIGGGISTSDSGNNVDSVDQMDDSQEAADDESWPLDDQSHSSHELDDLNRAVNTGFPTPVTPIDNEATPLAVSDRTLEALPVKGVGLVIGGGDLATAAFDWAGKNGEPDGASFLTYLQDEGVPPRVANDLLAQFGNGGSILAVALTPSSDEDALEQIAENYGAVTTGMFAAPRF